MHGKSALHHLKKIIKQGKLPTSIAAPKLYMDLTTMKLHTEHSLRRYRKSFRAPSTTAG